MPLFTTEGRSYGNVAHALWSGLGRCTQDFEQRVFPQPWPQNLRRTQIRPRMFDTRAARKINCITTSRESHNSLRLRLTRFSKGRFKLRQCLAVKTSIKNRPNNLEKALMRTPVCFFPCII